MPQMAYGGEYLHGDIFDGSFVATVLRLAA